MKNYLVLLTISIFFGSVAFGQMPNFVFDSTLNNLVHLPGYKTGEYAAIPEYAKHGKGAQSLILIPGWGFDASVYADFIAVNEGLYTMYALTIPGYGKTAAPALPDSGLSYGKQYWNNGVLKGIVRLIEKEQLDRPILIGNFVQGAQLALRMAIEYPTLVGGVIVIGAPAKFIPVGRGDPKLFTLEKRVTGIDTYMGPKWFKTITKKSFDEGNYLPELYSLDSNKAKALWQQSAGVPLPVMVQYLCEFFASDITLESNAIQSPVLIVRGMFNEQVLSKPILAYVKPQFIDSWDEMAALNPLIQIKDIKGAACFTWKDKPEETYREITTFITEVQQRRR